MKKETEHQPGKRKRVRRRVLLILTAVLIVLAGAGYGIGSYFVNYALSPSSSSAERNVEGAGHAQSELKDPDAYWDTVFTFIDTEIL